MQSPDTRRAILDRISKSTADLVALTRALVAAPSPNPPGDVTASAAVAVDFLQTITGAEVERFESAPGIVNVVARIPGGQPGRRVVFNGHLDTFPVGEDLAWTVPPFGGVEVDGRLYGRGVSDMKGGMAASMIAAQALAAQRGSWPGEIVITLAGDEENMGALGTRWLLDNVPHARGDAMICGDVGSPQIVRFGEKGLLWIEIEAEGSPAHGAHVHKGINAIDRLRAALDALKRAETIAVAAPPQVTAAIAAAKHVSEPLSGVGEADTLQRVTVNIGTIAGGTSANLVPASACAKADIRLPIGVSTATVETKLGEWLGAIDRVTWRVIRRYEPRYTDPDHEIVCCVAQAATEVLGERPVMNMRVGASDARLYRADGIPSVVFGCTPFNMGGADENILIAELVAVAKVHALAAFDFLTSSRQE
jgi:acetylornithine deacetylase/succinyl-diaminopimelate desuccinylase family protein